MLRRTYTLNHHAPQAGRHITYKLPIHYINDSNIHFKVSETEVKNDRRRNKDV